MNELGSLHNPFRDNVVTDAWQSPADVADIHKDVFQACLAGIDAASRGEPDSLLVYGPAGSGKTHLLTRVQRHLAQTARMAADQVLRCVFVYVRLQTAPQLLWQHVRRRLATDLMRREEGLTQLQRLVAHQIGHHQSIRPRGAVLQVRVLRTEDRDALGAHVARVASELSLPRDLSIVLEHLVRDESIRDASAWLAGDSLPEPALERLGLGTDTDGDREGAARDTVLGLCRLAAETLPIVFCFDQVEALLRTETDRDAFFRFGRLAGDLHDADPNVFLLTCLQSTQARAFKGAVLNADFDRLAKRNVTLDPLEKSQIASLLCARLDASEALRERRRARPADPFYPFDPAFVDELARDTPCVPRRVLAGAARSFEQLQRGEEPRRVDTTVFLTGQLDRRFAVNVAEIGAGESRNTIVRGAAVLSALGRADPIARAPGEDPAEIDLLLENPRSKARVALSVRDEADGRSLRPRLSALLSHLPKLGQARLVLVRDPRIPLSSKAVKAREHLAELRAKGAVIVEPTVEALAALATLSAILADAKSGDLANDGETIGEGAVLAWLRALAEKDPARVAAIDELTAALFAGPESPGSEQPTSTETREDEALRLSLFDLLSRRRVVPIDDAGREIAVDPDKLVSLARRIPDRCLVLEGPPLLLLDMAGVVMETEAAR
ncbi:MAG: ATP-binding protein [Polyangiaceae bacterium]